MMAKCWIVLPSCEQLPKASGTYLSVKKIDSFERSTQSSAISSCKVTQTMFSC